MKLGIMCSALVLAKDRMFGLSGDAQPSVEELINKAHELGAKALDGVNRDALKGYCKDPEKLKRLRGLLEETDMEIDTSWVDYVIENADSQSSDGFEQFIEEICHPLEMRIVTTIASAKTEREEGKGLYKYHRFRTDPPVEEQLERAAAAFSVIAGVAESAGITLALENHADYRSGEIIRLIKMVDSPSIMAKLDTANAFTVIEEPLDAALNMAPYTVTTHIKDAIIRPLYGQWVEMSACGLGEGNVAIKDIVTALAENSPRRDLPLVFEPSGGAPEGRTMEDVVLKSMSYLQDNFQDYLE